MPRRPSDADYGFDASDDGGESDSDDGELDIDEHVYVCTYKMNPPLSFFLLTFPVLDHQLCKQKNHLQSSIRPNNNFARVFRRATAYASVVSMLTHALCR